MLAGMRIRKKLVILHTCFSLVLAGVLAIAMRPAIREVVIQAELHEAGAVLEMLLGERRRLSGEAKVAEPLVETVRKVGAQLGGSVVLRTGTAEELALISVDASRARSQSSVGSVRTSAGPPRALAFVPQGGEEGLFITASVELTSARAAVVRLYVLMTLALLAVYALVALALEVFVLPQHVYGPIRTMLDADAALQEGRRDGELIDQAAMPADELGEIMRSRNLSVLALRRHERDLAAALLRLEEVATDLRRKNHMLEMARRNLADADRLANLGMMSAGIAHELNTPLAVLKGLVERLHESNEDGRATKNKKGDGQLVGREETALMLRVVGRLERLSESLLDFARVRLHRAATTLMKPLIFEAWTLVGLDRDARRVVIHDGVPGDLTAWCDSDRMLQVLVNLLRNAVDALEQAAQPEVTVAGERLIRDGRPWASITISDNGEGIDPELLDTLFQPFVSTRLDAKGTGLGLAVAYGIVREHGGVILARNKSVGGRGAVFEVLLPETEVGGLDDGYARGDIGQL